MTLLHKTTATPAETEAVGAEFATWLAENRPTGGVFVAMSGDLGAGKTTFVRGMARILAPAAHVSSPTYAIVNQYGGKRNLHHCDLYRISGEDDLVSVGFYDFVESGIVVVEWAERMDNIPAKEHFSVDIRVADEEKREVEIQWRYSQT